jgi:hypothetical protein
MSLRPIPKTYEINVIFMLQNICAQKQDPLPFIKDEALSEVLVDCQKSSCKMWIDSGLFHAISLKVP